MLAKNKRTDLKLYCTIIISVAVLSTILIKTNGLNHYFQVNIFQVLQFLLLILAILIPQLLVHKFSPTRSFQKLVFSGFLSFTLCSMIAILATVDRNSHFLSGRYFLYGGLALVSAFLLSLFFARMIIRGKKVHLNGHKLDEYEITGKPSSQAFIKVADSKSHA